MPELSVSRPPAPGGTRSSIGWLVNVTDFDAASVRYRCAHPLANLMLRGFGNRVYTKPDAVVRELADLDVIVIVKRLDAGIIGLVVAAAEAGKQVYLDLCDDLVSADGRSSLRSLPRAALRAIAPLLSAITCPTETMRARLQGYLQADGLTDTPVKVIPDCIETEDVYRVSEAAWNKTLDGVATQRAEAAGLGGEEPLQLAAAAVRLCWFGNWGGPHSDFGIASMLPVITRLNRYAHRHEISLHIVSNHEGLGELIQQRAKFPVSYHAWSRSVLNAVLAQSQFTLVTSGDDQFSAIKSPNRALLSLAAGVPVIVDAAGESVGSLWTDRNEIALTEDIVDILIRAREEGYSTVRERMLGAVRPSLGRFRLERIGATYVDIFEQGRRPRALAEVALPPRVAHVFGLDEDLGLSAQIQAVCREAGSEFMAITSLQSLVSRKSLFGFLGDSGLKPSIVIEADAVADDTRRLRGAQLVVQSSSGQRDLGAQVRQWCLARGVSLMSQGEFLYRFGRS